MDSLNGKVALVTGAGKGIGLAIAKMLASQGCNLMLNARTETDLVKAREAILKDSPNSVRVEFLPGSVARAEVVKAMVEATVDIFGKLDILINNAGVAPHFVLLQELTLDELDNTIDINLKGPMYAMKYAIPHMVHHGGGTVININSVAGKTAYPFSSVYCASKFGLAALTECVAGEQRSNNIKVIGIYPGEVHTPIWDTIEPGVRQKPEHMLDAQDIAEAVRYALTQPSKAFVKDITLVPLNPPPH